MPLKTLTAVIEDVIAKLEISKTKSVNRDRQVLETVEQTAQIVKEALMNVKSAFEPLYVAYENGPTIKQLAAAIRSALGDKGVNVQNRVSLFTQYNREEDPEVEVVILKGTLEILRIKARIFFTNKQQKRPHINIYICETPGVE